MYVWIYSSTVTGKPWTDADEEYRSYFNNVHFFGWLQQIKPLKKKKKKK